MSVHIESDLAVLGWNAKPEAMSAVTECIQKYRVQLNLTEHPDVRNANPQDLVTYLQTHPLKYCVMVVDAERVNTVATERDDHHLKLYKAAETNVGKIYEFLEPIYFGISRRKLMKGRGRGVCSACSILSSCISLCRIFSFAVDTLCISLLYFLFFLA